MLYLVPGMVCLFSWCAPLWYRYTESSTIRVVHLVICTNVTALLLRPNLFYFLVGTINRHVADAGSCKSFNWTKATSESGAAYLDAQLPFN